MPRSAGPSASLAGNWPGGCAAVTTGRNCPQRWWLGGESPLGTWDAQSSTPSRYQGYYHPVTVAATLRAMTTKARVQLRPLMIECWYAAEKMGWHEPRDIDGVVRDASLAERLCLVHEEVSEALQAYRRGALGMYFEVDGKPEGLAVEVADAVVRLLELAEHHDLDLDAAIEAKMAFNQRRGHRYGGKVI